MDPFRSQASLPVEVANRLSEDLHEVYAAFFPVAVPRDGKALKSFQGGEPQDPHRVFPVNMDDGFDFWDYTQQPGSIF
ncbi:unnamed protein product [Phytophthora lilii]|uniref:Unnamed protein product n=1 Tax=Phytophthora lilii TaxID=2077276 RepID=A0A9W6YJ04_9STRA|nr:unnamed protein product [Phytophthora lilii]